MTKFPVVLDAKEDISIRLPQNVSFYDLYKESDPTFFGRDSEGKIEFWLLEGKIVKVTRDEKEKK